MGFDALVTTFVTLFVVIDPIALAPLFVTLTRGMPSARRRRVGLRAVVVAFGLLALFGIAGEPLLSAIGIGLPAFRISGGMLLFLIAVDMLFEKRTERRERHTAEATADDSTPDPSVFPLATPMIAGPGALATMILLGGQQAGNPAGLIAVNLVMVATLGVTYLAFRAGNIIERALGATGVLVVTRLFGILLAALSVQFVLNGLRDLGVLSLP
ncbi:MarC family protein [Amaricoccus sp.]|uniref:MarC family protein n=1 Tax=Amaricoccus sp. TaxID=1872485 RepID=UPI0026289823|nr:MarC family protein [uncultured Amaricoccus sp.]